MPFEYARKEKCPDCFACQMCGETRCRVCRKCDHGNGPSDLGSGFTYAEYLAWKRKRAKGANEKGARH